MKKVKWTIEKLRSGFESFYKAHGHYPTATEIDSYAGLPSSRQIQRAYGGLPNLRKQLKLDGQEDYTKGAHSSERARMILKRAHKIELEVFEYLTGVFGRPFVHREFFFTDDKRTRTDFYINYKGGSFFVDVLYPKDRKNLNGCLNIKLNGYRNRSADQFKYPIFFLMMNQDMNDKDIEIVLKGKKIKLHPRQRVVTFQELKSFCKDKPALKLEKR